MGDPISAASVFVPQTPSGDETRRQLAGKSPKEVAKEFEAILLAQVISAMRKTVPESGTLEASANRKMLDGAFDQQVARSLVDKGGLGIADQIVGQIARQQAARDAAGGRKASSASALGAVANAAVADGAANAATLGRAAGASQIASAIRARIPSATSLRTHGVATMSAGAMTSAATVVPVAGEVSSPFGMRSDPFTGEPRFHAGVDVAAPRGSEIRAVADGEVVFSGWRPGGEGRVVDIRHADGLVTSYAHAERTLVRAGQHVVAGEVLATVGSSGRSSGPHLHFAAARDGQAIDPSALLGHGAGVLGAAPGARGTT